MHVSYWLMPRDEDAAVLRKVIDKLAVRFDAPRFRPHVTLYSGEAREMDAESIVRGVGRAYGLQALKAGDGFEIPDVLFVTLAAVVISFLATLYPSRHASRVNPVEALRYE